jgi:putative ABC transport system permease protein
MKGLLQDLRYAARVLRNAPGFTVVAVATLALGIGANTAIFSVVDGVLLRPLPYPQPERLVTVWQDMRARGGPAREWASPGNYVDWRAEDSIFSAVTAVSGWGATLTPPGEEPEPLVGEQVTPEYLQVMGVAPALGRGFSAADGVPNAPRVAMLSHALWERRFGSDPGVIGRPVVISGEPHQIVGVLPAGFRAGVLPNATIWRPLRLNTADPSRGAIFLRVIARLQPEVTLEQASGEMTQLARRVAAAHPRSNDRVTFAVIPLREQIVGDVRPALLVLLGAVGFVLLIACVNVANLLLARASHRNREMAIRMALGAARIRVVRQLMTESVVLAVVGGVAGVLLGVWGVSALVALAPPEVRASMKSP